MSEQKSNETHEREDRLEDKQRRLEEETDFVQLQPTPQRLSRPLHSHPLHGPHILPDLKK